MTQSSLRGGGSADLSNLAMGRVGRTKGKRSRTPALYSLASHKDTSLRTLILSYMYTGIKLVKQRWMVLARNLAVGVGISR